MTTNRKRVLLVGAGAIGGRHAQAMARVKTPIDFEIVDPVAEARQRAIILLNSGGGLPHGSVTEYPSLDDVAAAPDLAIIATNSRERPGAIKALLALGARSMILEKVLFTRLSDHEEVDRLLENSGTPAWVNCPRNAYPRASRLRELIGSQPFDYRVEGMDWGLACNLVHHLDEFSSLAGESDVRLSGAGLDETISPSKRPGYVEFFGKISGETSGQSQFTAISHQGSAGPRTVVIDQGDRRITVSPDQTLIVEDAGGMRTEPYPMQPQSQMTAFYVDAILNGKDPHIPGYAGASQLHRTMLSVFLAHIRRIRGDDTIDECPVT